MRVGNCTVLFEFYIRSEIVTEQGRIEGEGQTGPRGLHN